MLRVNVSNVVNSKQTLEAVFCCDASVKLVFADEIKGLHNAAPSVIQTICTVTQDHCKLAACAHRDVDFIQDVEIDDQGALEMAKRSRGTPRLANRLLKRVRDFAQVKYNGVITAQVASYALDLLDVDRCGLDHVDRNLLLTIIEKFGGGPVGLDTLAAAIGEDAGTIEDVYEPFLIKNGFIQRTPRGRIATEAAYQHLGIENLTQS